MTDHLEKYIRLNIDFPNKAGKIAAILATQKRLVEKLSRSKQSPEVQELLISVAEGYDVGKDLLWYMKDTLQGVANDSQSIIDGARCRNIIERQSELITQYLGK